MLSKFNVNYIKFYLFYCMFNNLFEIIWFKHNLIRYLLLLYIILGGILYYFYPFSIVIIY
jgi:hypothetical protein